MITYIINDMSEVCLVFIVFNACGKKAKVVNVPAIRPKIVIKFMFHNLFMQM